MALSKEQKILNKLKNVLKIDYDISLHHDLSEEQLKHIQNYTHTRSCGAEIIKHRKPKDLQTLYEMICECLKYGKANSLEKFQSMYGEELGLIKYRETNSSKAITLKKMIEIYGEDEGKVRWQSYCDKQALTNTFEYKRDKYGWTKEQFDEYNKTRSVTLDNLIKRHGEEKGTIIFESYVEKQRVVGITREYFVSTYGEKDGMEKYVNMLIKKVYQDGQTKTSTRSNMFIDHFNNICVYDEYIKEYVFYDFATDRAYAYDYVNHKHKFCIEFNGIYWHMKPTNYKADDINFVRNMTASEIWERDKLKRESFMRKHPDYKYYTVWEDEVYLNINDYTFNDEFVNEFVKEIKG